MNSQITWNVLQGNQLPPEERLLLVVAAGRYYVCRRSGDHYHNQFGYYSYVTEEKISKYMVLQ